MSSRRRVGCKIFENELHPARTTYINYQKANGISMEVFFYADGISKFQLSTELLVTSYDFVEA